MANETKVAAVTLHPMSLSRGSTMTIRFPNDSDEIAFTLETGDGRTVERSVPVDQFTFHSGTQIWLERYGA